MKRLFSFILVLLLLCTNNFTASAKLVSMKPMTYARDPHGCYTMDITSHVESEAKYIHNKIKKGKTVHYWYRNKNKKEIKAILAYMSLKYLSGQTEGEYPWDGEIYKDKKHKGYYKIDLEPKQYKKLRKHDQYVHSTVVTAIKSMKINTLWSEKDAVDAVNDWICNKCNYDYRVYQTDKYGDSLDFNWNAYQGLKEGVFVCEGYADLFQLFMNELGIRCYRIGSAEINHIWNVVILDGAPLLIDVCWNDTGGAYRWSLVDAFVDHGHSSGYDDIRDLRKVSFDCTRNFYNTSKGY